MTTSFRLRIALLLLTAAFMFEAPKQAVAEDLSISPVAQQTPVWCWAAAAEMVFDHYGFPNLNPGGNFQCAIVAAQGGPCFTNCGLCINAGGSTQRIAQVMRQYAAAARHYTGYVNPDFRPRTKGIMTRQEIIDTIDGGAPIIAGITPSGVPFPPGAGFSQHAVVIVGYEGAGNGFEVIVNDPYPYPYGSAPYLQAGATMLQAGQYQIRYQTFVSVFKYGNSITFD